ncbi:type VI secretion system Vgr family protein [Chitinimonas arctica]|uniref:type VI secretion system Vgr family protein n=1 Tax=Chitinimonas arctica TaxID=2594795 RepID=UPI001CC49619|nr:type VI secretion system tip protein TssI/VgrG [Chitinimonas arctica]
MTTSLFTQKNRQLAVKGPLAADTLLLLRMQGEEALGRLSEYRLDLLGTDADLDFDALLGQDMSVTLALAGGGERQFNGIVSEFGLGAALPQSDRLLSYQAVLRPRLWLLTRASHCRFFSGKTVLQIVLDLLERDYHIDVDNQCSASYPVLPHCAQYRESDFDFFSRLIEREGIYYFFRHAGGKHTLVLADSPQVHTAIPGYGQVDYKPWGAQLCEAIRQWRGGRQLQAGRFSSNAFDFEAPSKSGQQGLLARAKLPQAGELEQQDCPAPYTDAAQGERYARIALQAHKVLSQRIEAETNARGVCPGGLFRLNGHPRADQNRQYLVISASYTLHSDAYATVLETDAKPVFACTMNLIGHDVGFCSQPLTTKPSLTGPQTAMVVGPEGEEIHTDQYGRVMLQFHWEQFSPAPADKRLQRCWVRVAQGWAGKRWGSLFLPRVGQEVIVEFLDGDPDQPIVAGSVYNAANMPPYALPAKAAISTIKTASSKGGGGFNELRFNDAKGSEQLFIRAEKDWESYVKHDALTWVGRDQHLQVEGKQFVKVGGAMHTLVGGDHNQKVDGSVSLQTGKDLLQKAGMNFAVDSGMAVHIKAGTNLVIEAGASITLKAGGGSIVIGPASVSITGTPVLLNAGGGAGAGAGCSPTAPTAPLKADDGSKELA